MMELFTDNDNMKNKSNDVSKTAYSLPHEYDSYEFEYKKRKNSDAGCLITAVMFILIAGFLAGIALTVIDNDGRRNTNAVSSDSAEAIASSEVPSNTAQAEQGNIPTPLPLPAYTQRPMPEYDGELPIITDTANPFPEIIENSQKAVVSVYNYGSAKNIFGNSSVEVQGSGTGFVISSEGYVITNAHVIEGAVKVTLVLYNNMEVNCEVIGLDVSTDIAVLRFDNSLMHIKPLYLGDSTQARVGEFVITIGDPSGRELAGTITFGIVSAVDRAVNIDGRVNTYIQTDAAMNPGNSGGPLINMRGEVIGVNSAKTVTASYDKYGNAISAEGLGFAIPINQAKEIAEKLITKGRIERPGIGFTIYPAKSEQLYDAGLEYGLCVESTIAGGPADSAGIKAGDILVSCDGKELHENVDLTSIIQNHKMGDVLIFKLYREKQSIELSVVIGDLNAMN